jgi:hypothetical protein
LEFLVEPKDLNINYIIACYFGQRRTKTAKSPEDFLEMHLKWLQENQIALGRVTVVINAEDISQATCAANLVAKYKPYYTDLRFFVRRNIGHSYGAWSDAIETNLDNDEHFSHYFLIEDDYLPNDPKFIDYFLSKFIGNVAYVCQLILPPQPGIIRHASISNGLLHGAAASGMRRIGERVFVIHPSIDYKDAEVNQVRFLDNLFEHGFDMNDVSDITSIEFVEKSARTDWRLKTMYFGDQSKPLIIKPIIEL